MQNAKPFTGYDRNAGKRWRREDLALLRSFARKGMPLRLISLKLGRPDAAIRTKARELNLTLETGSRVVAPAPVRTLIRRPSLSPTGAMGAAREDRQLELFDAA